MASTRTTTAKRSAKAFTLVELLVVIAIITILASMLLPTLGRAVRHARMMTCMNHQHQLGIRVGLYMSDFGDLPHCQPTQAANQATGGLDNIWIEAMNDAGVLDEYTDAFCTHVRQKQYRSNGTSYYYGWRLHYSNFEWGYKVDDQHIYMPYRWFGPMMATAQDDNTGHGWKYIQDSTCFNAHSKSEALKTIRNDTSKRDGNKYFRTTRDGPPALLTCCVDPKRIRDTEEGFFGHEDKMMVTPGGIATGWDIRTYLMSDGASGMIQRP